ncbi:hypothetical protein CERZMDRAFT_99263 [Cercospora zeae-maydis SCOH1-5]|uniref:Uncharacterized protein n=1 Tax=Cercospora zeae-maydis SCOH1-5 TaxID=717836 RepID=A0A6A6FB30_9PEZI|nr:hypothetical protein CERZMDRAFT_99263 [Cercospora zeae-maydis SCOH1-5]
MPSPQRSASDGRFEDAPGKSISFPVLDLTPELVLRVLEHALIVSSKDNPIVIRGGREDHKQPAVTRVCRLFRSEGLPLFYKHNVFMFETDERSTYEFFHWIRQLGLQCASTIQSLHAYWFDDYLLSRLNWNDLINEMNWLKQCAEDMRLERGLVACMFVRFRGRKIVLGSGRLYRCYELSFGQVPRPAEEWRRVADFPDLGECLTPNLAKKTDCWVLHSDADCTATEVVRKEDGQDGGASRLLPNKGEDGEPSL